MNAIKTGQFILKLREKNKLTQKEFANILNVTSQAVSKWENGRGLPDIEFLKIISDKFNVDISDLLNGEVKNKVKKVKSKILFASFIFVTIVVLISGILIFENKSNDFNFLSISSQNPSFNVKGIAAYTLDKKSIFISNIEHLNEDNKNENYIVIECVLYETVNNVEKKIHQCGDINKYEKNIKTKTLSEFLKTVEINIDNYPSSCKNLSSNNLHIVINAIDTKDKVVSYKIPIKLENCTN